MKNIQTITIVFFLLMMIQSSQSLNLQGSLELVQLIELSRHGARSPFYDLWDFKTNWNLPLQTLTQIGQRQHYLIGQELYDRYSQTIFNNGQFTPNQVSVQSTTSDRAQQSALSQFYGIYQKKGQNMDQSWKFHASTDLPPMKVENGKQILENLDGKNLPNSYAPINVQVNAQLLEPTNNCNGYDILKALNFKTDIYNQFDQSQAAFKEEFLEKFELQSQYTVKDVSLKMISDYWDSVICDIYQQISLPSSFTQEFIQKMNFIYDFQQLYIDFNSDNGNLLKLQTSNQFKDIIDVIRNKSNIKFKFYSASDNNLNAVLIASGYSSYTSNFEEWLKPTTSSTHTNTPFASTIFFEIYQNKINNKKYVKMIYNDEAVHINGCSSILCDFEDEFVPSITQAGIIPDSFYDQVCSTGY